MFDREAYADAVRCLSKRETQVFLSVVQLLYSVGVHWTMAPVIRFGREALARRNAAGPEIGSWLVLVVSSATLVAGLAVGAVEPLARRVPVVRGSLLLLVAFFCAVVLAKVQEHLLQMASLMPAYVAGRMAGKVAVVVTLGLLLASRGGGGGRTDEVLGLMAAGFAVQAVSTIPVLARQRWGRPSVDGALIRSMALFAAPLAGRAAASYLLEWVDVYWLAALRSASEVGIYYSAYQVMIVATEALGAVTLVAFPILTDLRARGADTAAYARLAPQIAVGWSLVIGALGVAVPHLLPFAFGRAFVPAGPVMAVLMVAASFQSVIYLSLPVFTSHDMTARASLLLAPMVVVNVIGDILLVPRLGPIGAAAATAATYGLGAFLHARLLRRALGGVTWAFVAPTVAVAPALALAALGRPPLVTFTTYALGATLLLAVARRRLFARTDADLLEGVALPRAVRDGLTRMYALLG